MKILHYSPVYAPAWKWGGPPRSVANLCEGLVLNGHDVTVYTTNAGLEDNPEYQNNAFIIRNGVKVHYFESENTLLGILSKGLVKKVNEEIKKFDLIHITGVWQPTSVSARKAALKANVPYVISPRGALSPYSFKQKYIKKWLWWKLFEYDNCVNAKFIHYTSEMEMEETLKLNLNIKSVIVPNSINTKEWYYDYEKGKAWRKNILSKVSIPEGTRTNIILYAGRLHHKKGLDIIPKVLSILNKNNWIMVFMGDSNDETKSNIIKEAINLNIRNKIIFETHGDANLLRAAYSGADIFLLPSLHENFGNVAVEALACNCHVILSDKVGAADQIIDFDGVEVYERKIELWQNSILNRFDKPITTDRTKIIEKFSTESVAKKIAQEYSLLIKNNSI